MSEYCVFAMQTGVWCRPMLSRLSIARARGGRVVHAVAAVHPLDDRLDLVAHRLGDVVDRRVVRGPAFEQREHFARERLAAGAALLPDLAERHVDAQLRRVVVHHRQLRVGVGQELVDRDDDGHAELPDVPDVVLEMRQAALERREIADAERALVGAALHLERAHRRDEHRGFRVQPADAALDVEELLRAEIGAEARFGDDDVAEREAGARGEDAVAAVRDVAERPGVQDRGAAFERLHEVRADARP